MKDLTRDEFDEAVSALGITYTGVLKFAVLPNGVHVFPKGGGNTRREQLAYLQQMIERTRKRESNGQYAFDGRLDRICVCGHTLGHHSAGSQKDCIFYSLAKPEKTGQPGEDRENCGCVKFRESKRKSNAKLSIGAEQ